MRLIRKLQDDLFILTVIIVLFFGALSPVFRGDDLSNYVGAFSVSVLTILSLRGALSRAKPKQDNL